MSTKGSPSQEEKPTKKRLNVRTRDDVELLKIILDEDLNLKKKVLRFIQKNYPKAVGTEVK